MDFREFSEAYNDYLIHRHGVGYNAKRTAKEWNMIKRHAENIKGLDINYLKYRITEADYDKAVDYYTQGENTLGDEILSKYAGVVYHDNFREFSEAYNNYLMHYGVKGMKWHDHRYAQDPDAKREHNTDIYNRTKIDKQIKVAMQKLEDVGDFDDAENMEGIIREKQEELRSFDPTDPRDAAKIKAYKDLIAALIEKRNQKFGKGENKLYGTTYARRWR